MITSTGRVQPQYQGAFVETKTYTVWDWVTYERGSYIALTITTANLPTDTRFWFPASLPGGDGQDGRETELRATSTYIQWRYVGETAWRDLIALELIKGDPGETGGQGIQGPPGESIKGDPGTAATIEVGSVESVEPDLDADITNTGTTTAAVLNFKIPRGKDGNGFVIKDFFSTFESLVANVPSPEAGDAYGVGTEAPYDVYIYGLLAGWINNGQLKGPKGDPGRDGKDGESVIGPKGDPGTNGVTPNISAGTTTTLSPGQPATVARDPASPDAAPVFNFGIPAGQRGESGVMVLPLYSGTLLAAGWAAVGDRYEQTIAMPGIDQDARYRYAPYTDPTSAMEYGRCMVMPVAYDGPGMVRYMAQDAPEADITAILEQRQSEVT